MKKFLMILVMVSWCSVGFAEKITQICKDVRTEPPLKYMKLTLDKDARTVTDKMVYTDAFLLKHNITQVKSWTRTNNILFLDDKSVTYYLTNSERWNDNFEWHTQTGQGNAKYWNVNNKRSLKKLRKNEGPDNMRVFDTVWNYNSEGNSLKQSHYRVGKDKVIPDTNSEQFICYSEARFKKQNQEEKEEEIKQASDEMKQEIEPLKAMCRNIGYSDGTEKFADCVKDLYLKKLDAQTQSQTTTTTSKPKRRIDPSVWDDILDVSRGLGEGKSVSEALGGTTTGTTKIQCFKSGERVSGTNKICSYNCMGSETTTNISSTSICPMSIDLN